MTKRMPTGVKHNKIVDDLILESKKVHELREEFGLFPFVTYKDGTHKYLCKVIGYKHIRYAGIDEAIEHLVTNYRSHDLGFRESKEIINLFKSRCPEIGRVKMIDFADGENWTFHRTHFGTPCALADPPDTFMEFLSNSTNAAALAAFIGSLFFDDSSKQQYVWMYGQGKNGKSSLMRFMCKLLGASACTSQPEYIMKNNFGTSLLIGKRLCMFPDTNNYGFVKSGLFKSLTGGDQVKIEKKNEQAYNIELPTKFIISSNDQPMITAQDCDLRRIIFCELGKPKRFDPLFEDYLWAQAEGIVGYCMDKYSELTNSYNEIICDSTQAETIARSGEFDDWEQVISEAFIIDDKDQEKLWCPPALLKRILTNFYGLKDQNAHNSFKKHLKNQYDISSVVKRDGDKTRRVYKNLIVRDPKMTRPVTARNEKVVTRMDEHNQDQMRECDENGVINLPNWRN